MPDLALLPGMPVETFLRTEDRTPLSYLTQPLTVYFQRAFREE
jgi:multidrug efflux pump subunit AcrA (membrane-fusion protein)